MKEYKIILKNGEIIKGNIYGGTITLENKLKENKFILFYGVEDEQPIFINIDEILRMHGVK